MCLPACAAHPSEMSLVELPAAVLDVVVECAGFEHGWRLEVVSSSLQATSMECAAVRLGKCRWMGGNRGTTEFAPSWRHVAVALRRCSYHVLHPNMNGHALRLFYPRGPHSGRARPHGDFVWRDEADKFAIEPTGDGEGIIRDHPSGRYNATSRYHGLLTYQTYNNIAGLAMMSSHLLDASVPWLVPTPWLLHLGSHASHLPFRRCRNWDGDIVRVLRTWRENTTSYHVPHWELAPATLADDERFEWRV